MALLGLALLLAGARPLEPDGQVIPGPSSTATVSADTLAAAAEAHVDVIDLLGAMATSSLTARQYLIGVGELTLPTPPAPVIRPVWFALAQCEATGNWRANTGNGYYGGLQEDMTFWRNHGGLAYAPRPDLASPAAQVAVAERGLSVQGWAAWPACSRRLGLR